VLLAQRERVLLAQQARVLLVQLVPAQKLFVQLSEQVAFHP
jgi:hypothetical protein